MRPHFLQEEEWGFCFILEHPSNEKIEMKLIDYAFLALLVLFQTSCIDDSLRNQVTVYPVLETKDLGLLPLNRTVYKIFPDSQIVIYWSPGINEVPRKLAKCVVRDRLHWQCEYPDRSATLTMNDGEFKELSAQKGHVDNLKYVSCWKWWMLHFRMFLK